MADIKKLIDEIKKLTIVELNDLVKEIEKEFGVTAAAPVAVAGGAAAGGAAAAAAEEQTEFSVVLKNAGASKINVIKVVRELTGLGLVEAKNLVESLGTVKESLPKAEAEKVVASLKAAGAEAEMK